MSLLSLPNELLHSVTKHLDLDRDINALAQTNRLFYSLLNDHLYRRSTERGRGTALLWAAANGQLATAQSALGGGANASYRILHDALLAAAWNGRDSEGITQLLLETLEAKREGEGGEPALRLLINETKRNLIVHTQPRYGWIGVAVAIPLSIIRRLHISRSSGGSRPQIMVLMHSRVHTRHFPEVFKQGLRDTRAIDGVDALKISAVLHDPSGGHDQIHDGHVVAGTPGYLRDQILKKSLNPEGIRLLIIQSVDDILDWQLDHLCRPVKQVLPENIQIIIFTERFPEEVREFSREFAPDSITTQLVQPQE